MQLALIPKRINFKSIKLRYLLLILAILACTLVAPNIMEFKVVPHNFNEAKRRMAARRKHLKNECTRRGLDAPKFKTSTREFLINRQYHLIWCNVFKAASTSWFYNFNIMANYTKEYLNTTKKVPLELARVKYIRPSEEMLKEAQKDSITFLIVRHPLERLASAYIDKIVHAKRKTGWFALMLKIFKKYRKRKKGVILKKKLPYFEEFVSFVLDEARDNKTLNEHWIPYTELCYPCKIEYDVIIKFETLNEDQKYLIWLAHIERIVNIEWKNKKQSEQHDLNLSSLYSRISRRQLEDLHSLYKNDFNLFNYSVDDYYKIVKKN